METEKLRYKELGNFLKTRRAGILPSQVGVDISSPRRTPGLRREELAQLAGISLTWYTWLEQGRPIQVSAQVIESLCRVLLLNKEERYHLYTLANIPYPTDEPAHHFPGNPVFQHLLDSMPYSPAFIIDQRWNVISWNKAASVIFGDFSLMNARQRNVVWGMFTDPYYKTLYTDWKIHAQGLLGKFRITCAKFINDPWLIQFIEDLKEQSPEFTQWWDLHDIQNDSWTCKQFIHPVAGELVFESSNYDVPDHSGYKLFIHVPVPGTDTTEKMKSILE